MALHTRLQVEVIAWVNNNWQTQWIAGSNTSNVGVFAVQVRIWSWLLAG
jgi:hypothetical protein